jgi:anaerobic selenocysteine-containing dehydrogenase
LPCLGRSEIDVRGAGGGKQQFVTVENSMGVVHRSEGQLAPASDALLSESAIVAGIARATFGQRGEGGGAAIAWEDLTDDYDRIRDLIERAVVGFDKYNERVRAADGFLLPNGVRERSWATKSRRVELTVNEIPPPVAREGQLVMMTIRTHDQFNTTIYEVNDRYRGVYGERKVVFVNVDDLHALGLRDGERVDVTSHFRGEKRDVHGFKLVAYDIPRGCCAAYFPETNPLVPLDSQADESGTPTSKSFAVTFARAADA